MSVPDADALPIGSGEASAAIVSALDDDGNEVAGVRLPQLVEPVATLHGLERATADRRPARSDARLPRQSSAARAGAAPTQRYADRADYEVRVRATARGLVADRFLLPEDVELVTADAVGVYDESLASHESGRR